MQWWTESDIPDQSGRTVIITGANSGLGERAAHVLAGAGAEVVLACRSLEKAAPVAAAIGPRATVRRLDLADLSSVRAFADSVETVDVLINNAGVMAIPFGRTVDGFEMQFGTNHLGHFALTGLLLDRITDRVVTLSSVLHRLPGMNLDDPNFTERRYGRWRAYGQAKRANLVFGYELARRLEAAGSPLRSIAAHPGYARTHLAVNTRLPLAAVGAAVMNGLFAQTARLGTLPELYAATVPDAPNGAYYGPNVPGGLWGFPHRCGSNRASRNLDTARRLWEESEKLTGVVYPLPT